ncbi:MAG: hypothetical protein GX864_02805 [Mollicutes bacterium]|nr:hypothetical protein [Mollicutes bacterium]
MNYEILLIQIVIGLLIGLVLIKLYQTKRSISYEKRLGTYSISSVKDNELSFFDQVYLFFYGLIKSFSKFISRFKSSRKKSRKYQKYITYAKKDEYEPIDLLAIKYLILITSLVVSILFSLAHYNNLNYLIIILSLSSFYLLDIILIINYKRKKDSISIELLKAITIMNNAFKTGRNVIQAIETVTTELNGPIVDEFKKILVDLKYGLSYDAAFKRFYQRVRIDDARYIATSLILVNKTGGSIKNVFKNIEYTIMTRKKLENELKTLTSAARMMYKALIVLPIIMVLVILLLNNSYFTPFFKSPIGVLFFFLASILFITYIILVKNILRVKIK